MENGTRKGREGKRAPRGGESPSTQTGGEGAGEGHPGRGEPPGGSLEAPRPNCEQRSPGRGPADVRPGTGSPAPGAKERTGSRLNRIPFQAAGPPPGRGPGRGRARGGSWRSVALSGTPSQRTRPRGRGVPPWRAGLRPIGPQAAQCTSGFVGEGGLGSRRPPGGAVHVGSEEGATPASLIVLGRRSARRSPEGARKVGSREPPDDAVHAGSLGRGLGAVRPRATRCTLGAGGGA